MKTTLILALALAGPAMSQGITLAEGDTIRSLTITVLSESDVTRPGNVILEDVEFLDFEKTGRTRREDLDTSRARRVVANGLWRIEVPGAGRLLHYRREEGDHYGFLWVPPNGLATVVVERDGGDWSESPFADRIGVAADGRHAAAPLTGGGLDLLDLRDGSRRFVPTSTPVIPASVMVGRSHAFFQTEGERLWRVSLTDRGPAEDVTPASQPHSALKTEMAMSGDGTTLVFLFGKRAMPNLWALGGAGPATRLAPPARTYKLPGYLPEGDGKPLLLLNDDGTSLMYADKSDEEDEPWDNEFFLLDLTTSTYHHFTRDALFTPYIGVGILPFFRASTLILALGHPNRMDWFAADTVTGTVSNLSRTGPDGGPFGEGNLDPLNAVVTPGGMLSTERTITGDLRLRSLDPGAGTAPIRYRELLGELMTGMQFNGEPDLLVRTKSGDRLLDGNTGAELVAESPGIALSAPIRAPDNKLTLFRATADGLSTAAFRLADGGFLSIPAQSNLKQAVLTSTGAAVINADTLSYLAPRVFTVIPNRGDAITLVLSGAGT